MRTIFTSSRLFIVQSYTASHGLLLLRSAKSQDHSKRIDVLFQDVRAAEMRFWFAGITIQEQPKGYLDTFASKPSVLVEPGNVIYGLQGADWSGYVVAGICRIAEDDGEVNDPSTLLG